MGSVSDLVSEPSEREAADIHRCGSTRPELTVEGE